MFGDGLFETMRAQDGRVLYLEQHLDRFFASADYLRICLDRNFKWNAVIDGLLRKNNLDKGVARIKLIATRGVQSGMGLPCSEKPTLIAMAEKYEPPTDSQYAKGWDLITCQLGPAPPLAPHKTLNFLFYMAARQFAVDAGANEALVIDKDGNVAETATGSILACDKNGWFTPKSLWQLPGTALEQMIFLLEKDGFKVKRRVVSPKDLIASQSVFILNSLMGLMPIKSIDHKPMALLDAKKATALRRRLFE